VPNLSIGPATYASVQALIASSDDRVHRQIRVAWDGRVYVSDVIGNLDLDSCRFALPTFCAGTDYLGIKAASDQGFVERVMNTLNYAWANGLRGIVDYDRIRG